VIAFVEAGAAKPLSDGVVDVAAKVEGEALSEKRRQRLLEQDARMMGDISHISSPSAGRNTYRQSGRVREPPFLPTQNYIPHSEAGELR
jgi:hypothetical protein